MGLPDGARAGGASAAAAEASATILSILARLGFVADTCGRRAWDRLPPAMTRYPAATNKPSAGS